MSKLTIHVVLDRSGSMASCKTDAIGGFNSYVESIAKESPTSVLTLSLFDSGGIDVLEKATLITKVKPLDDKTFVPRGNTPLYDAIGKAVVDLSEQKGKKKVLVILTDGHENSSQEYTKHGIKKLLDEKQEKEGWLVTYLAANQDAMAVGAGLGVSRDNSLSFNTANVRASFSASAASTMRYGRGTLKSTAYTAEERASAMADDETK